MVAERNYQMDHVKYFLILCVVLGHIANRFSGDSVVVASAQFWIYLFHMPAFVFVSGLFSQKAVAGNRWDKAVPYIFLFVLMKSVTYFVNVFLNGAENASIDFFSETGPAWYALAMFWWYAVMILIKKVRPAYVITIALLLAALSGYSTGVNNFLVIQRTLIFFPFFYAGWWIGPERLMAFVRKIWVRICGAVVLVISIAISFIHYEQIAFWRDLFRGRYAYAQIGDGLDITFGGIWRLEAYVISFILTIAVIAVMPNIRSFVAKLGQRTLPVYVFHYPVMALVLGKWVWFKDWMGSGHVAIHCLIFCILLALFTALPVFNWPLKRLMKVPHGRKT